MINKSFVRVSGVIFLFFVLVIINHSRNPEYNSQSSPARENTVPRFEPGACAIQIPDGTAAECGNLFVAENRKEAGSPTIRVGIIIIKSTSANPQPDPIIYTGGGPGNSSLARAGGAKNLAPYTKDRDFIIFEQRGTGFAEPSLRCPEIDAAIRSNGENNIYEPDAHANEVKATAVCHDRLVKSGVDLSAYTTTNIAADMEDLRRVLNIKRWNLYGVSYSSRLMLNYVRDYPKGVRSVVLDSVLPPTVNWDEGGVDAVVKSLNIVFDYCEHDPKCSAAYPKIKDQFFEIVRKADQAPFAIDTVSNGKNVTVKLNGSDVVDAFYNGVSETDAIFTLPSAIADINKGNVGVLKGYANYKLRGDGFIWGMRYSVWCGEEMPFEDPARIAAQGMKYPELKGFMVGMRPDTCRAWNVRPAGTIENKPVKSNVPALMFAGEYDPNTPPAWAYMVKQWFPHSYAYSVKSTSHGVLFGNQCAIGMAAAFFDNPMAKPDDSCLEKIPAISFR